MHPWPKLATDIFHFEIASYLLIVDYTSRFPVVCMLSSMTSLHIANQGKLIFSEYGWPETPDLRLWSMLYLTSLHQAMTSYNVNHITSSLHYPQSNGLAEKYVQIVKSLFYKAKEECKDFYKCLMINYNTTLTGGLQSPMQILQGRNTRSDLPMSNADRKQLWYLA